MLVLWKNNVSEHKFSVRVKVHHFLVGQHLEGGGGEQSSECHCAYMHTSISVALNITRSKAILQLLVRPRFIIIYVC